MTTSSSDTPRRSFDPPQEPDWHRMIAEAAYYLAQKRGFLGKHSLDDWLAAEQQVRQVISPVVAETTMDATGRNEPISGPEALAEASEHFEIAFSALACDERSSHDPQ